MKTKSAGGRRAGRPLIALIVVLALTAALGAGAAPALAADGCTCHSAVPPTDGAPAAHAPFVVSVTDCTTCHAGMLVPHPEVAEAGLYFHAQGDIVGAGREHVTLDGRLLRNRLGVPGVTVYLQQRAAGASEFEDVGHVTTSVGAWLRTPGWFSSILATLAEGMTYRAVAQGFDSTGVVMPHLSATVEVSPGFVLWKMRGLHNGTMRLGRTVTVTWRGSPSWFAGESARLTLVKASAVGGHERIVQRVSRVLTNDGRSLVCTWRITPTSRGNYSVSGIWPATGEHGKAVSDKWAIEVL